jgi:hydrogenase expression/formation protein HypE
VSLVTGDTKVVERGRADGLYITTAGLGERMTGELVHPAAIAPGDAVLLSGDIGRHGIAVMLAREELPCETVIESDCAPLAAPVLDLLAHGIPVHCLRDCTRGGLASAVVEIARAAGRSIVLDEPAIPVSEPVASACEILGFDPLHVANEGRFVAFVPAPHAESALAVLHRHAVSASAACIGHVRGDAGGEVALRGALGVERALDLPSGEQLPRIC